MNFKVILGSILVACVLLVGACESTEPSPVLKPFKADPVVSERVADFSFDFFKQLHQEDPTSGQNIFVSPISLHIALGMLLNGAQEETEAEIEKVLKVNGINRAQLNAAYLQYIEGLPEVDSKVKLHLANAIWYDQPTFEVLESYKRLLSTSFLTQAFPEDFSLVTTRNKINNWASEKTQGKITKVVEELDADLVMILMNAIYFKGNWQSKFEKDKTKAEDFILQDGSKKKVAMMSGSHPAYITSTPEEVVVQLGYGGGEYTMTLFLPTQNHTIDEVIQKLDYQKWASVHNQLQKSQVNVFLPRFTLEQELNLNSVLMKMGMPKVFSNSAQLQGISNASTKVSYVKQNTFLQVDENGSEAAAVTSIGVVPTSSVPQPMMIRFDRPFVLVISEKTSGSILFMGKIMNPDSE